MATIKHFSDFGGETVELVRGIGMMDNAEFRAKFPGVKGRRCDGFSMLVGYTADKRTLPVTRSIDYKRNPSLHVCNARCMGGKANGACECSCGGRNHGAGMFTALLAEAA